MSTAKIRPEELSSEKRSELHRLRSCRISMILFSVLLIACCVWAFLSAGSILPDDREAFLDDLAVFCDARNETEAVGYQATIDTTNAKLEAETALQALYDQRDAASEADAAAMADSIADAEAAVRAFFENDADAEAAMADLAGAIKKDNSNLTIDTNKLAKITGATTTYAACETEALQTKEKNRDHLTEFCLVAAAIGLLLLLSAFLVNRTGDRKRKALVLAQILASVLAVAVLAGAFVMTSGSGFTADDTDLSISTSFAAMCKKADKAAPEEAVTSEAGLQAAKEISAYLRADGSATFSDLITAMDASVSAAIGLTEKLLILAILFALGAMMTGITLYAGFIQVRRIIAYAVLILLSFLCLFFFYLLLINCTRTSAEIQSGISFLPGTNFVSNWNKLMAQEDLPVWYGILNSLFISTAVAALSTYVSSLTAYAIHAYNFKFKNIAFKFILLIMMIPTQVSTLGFLDLIRDFGWTKGYLSFLALILPSMAAPTVFFFMKQYMDSALPLAIVEASRIDGCSEFGTFNRIVLPIMKPAIAVQAIFSFVSSWNNYFTPALVIDGSDPTKKTLPIMIATLRARDPSSLDQGMVYMMIAISILPVVIVYFCLSKFIIRGVSLGGVKE